MGEIGATSAGFLSLVFVVAGWAKLRRRAATTASFAGLGLPAPAGLAVAVPVAEMVVAAFLVARPRPGAVMALAALAAFSAVLLRATRAGSAVSCGCFGTASARPVTSVDLVRNALLAVAAVAALGAGGPAAPTVESAVLVTTAAVVGAVVLALCDLRRHVGAVWDNRLAGEPAA